MDAYFSNRTTVESCTINIFLILRYKYFTLRSDEGFGMKYLVYSLANYVGYIFILMIKGLKYALKRNIANAGSCTIYV